MRRARVVAIAGLVAWIVNAAIAWLSAAPLGHDEAQYALSAQDWLAGAESRWFYVSKGMSVVAAIGTAAGHGEIAVRFPAFVLGIAFVVAAGALAWRTFGAMTGAWTIAVLAGLRAFAGNSAELLSDLPAAAFLLAGTLVLVEEVVHREDGPRWYAVLAAPAFAAALYLRYASCVPIAIVSVAVLALRFRAIARRPAPIVVAAGVFVVLLVPHFIAALHATGSALGILLASKSVPGQTWIAQGLVTYVTSNPMSYYGVLAPLVLLPGLAAPLIDRRPTTLLLWIAGVADVVALGLISHAQARYIFFGLVLLVILGVEVLRRVLERRPALAIVAAVAVAMSWVLVARLQLERDEHRRDTTAATRAAADAIRADTGGAHCRVVGDAFAQLEWYSGCAGSSWPWDVLGHERIYVVQTPATAPVVTRGTPTVVLHRADVTVSRYDR